MTFFSCNALKCASITNQEWRVRPEIININSSEPTFYSYSAKVNKCSGSCNNIHDVYAKLCVSDVVKNINIKVFNITSRTNEKRHTEWHETCKCKCWLDVSICNNKQSWNKEKWRWKFKKLIDKGRCDEGFIWDPSKCECECDKSCDVVRYLD